MTVRYPTPFWFRIRFQVRYGNVIRYGNAGQIKIFSGHTRTEGYTVHQNQEKFKIRKSKFEPSNVLKIFRQKGSKGKEKITDLNLHSSV
jgi:hypothetical protein